MNLLKPSDLRLPTRAWKVKLIGEGADDAGGVFDDTITEMCQASVVTPDYTLHCVSIGLHFLTVSDPHLWNICKMCSMGSYYLSGINIPLYSIRIDHNSCDHLSYRSLAAEHEMCCYLSQELKSGVVPLLIPTPNAANEVGYNRDR